MTILTWFRRLKYLFPRYRRTQEDEVEAELRSLAEIAAEDAGSEPAARRTLGNLTLAREDTRAVWGWTWLASLAAHASYALRVLCKDRSFTMVAVLSRGRSGPRHRQHRHRAGSAEPHAEHR